jgi:hemerythrin-like domain-containing protein
MDPLTSLRDEHSSVLQEVYSIDRQLGWLESTGPEKARRILLRLLSYSERLAVDLSLHFQREEKALYPVLEKRMEDNTEPVMVMKQEHQRLTKCLDAFTSEVSRMLKEHDAVKTWNLSSILQDLRSELSDHVSREERVLFWLAELHLSRGDRNKVSFELAQMNRPGAEPEAGISPTRLG